MAFYGILWHSTAFNGFTASNRNSPELQELCVAPWGTHLVPLVDLDGSRSCTRCSCDASLDGSEAALKWPPVVQCQRSHRES